MSFNRSKLVNPHSQADGSIVCACPQCLKEGHDKGKNHLKIWKTGAFNCSKYKDDRSHNRQIRALLLGYRDDGSPDDIEFVEMESRLSVERVYPENTLDGLIKNYDYWKGRGVKENVLTQLENGVASQSERGKLSGRSVFPVRDLRGRIMGFSGRLIIDNSFSPKWKHCFTVGRSVYPWNITGNDIKASRTAVLTESIGDAISLLSADIKPVLCIFGLNLNGLIISTLIGANVQRLIISLNRDEDPQKGQAAAERLERKLSPFFSRVEIRLPNGFKDWNEALMGGERGLAELAAFRAEVGT